MAAPGLLANDTDADGDTLTAAKVTDPAHGTVTVNANGSISYVPAAGYFGPDSFTYRANDGALDSNTVTVSLTVSPTNAAPVAVADAYSTPKNTTLTVAAPGVLGNDTDADGDTLSSILVANVAHGTLTLGANGSISYVPTANYVGPDSFTYKANDGALDSNTVTVSLTVTPTNAAPVAVADSYSSPRTAPSPSPPRASSPTTPTPTATPSPRSWSPTSATAPSASTPTAASATPGRQLQRPRQLHLQGQRRGPRFEHRHGQPHRQPGQRRPGRGRRQLLDPQEHDPRRGRPGPARQRHRRRRRHPDRDQGHQPGPRHGHGQRQRLDQLRPDRGLLRPRQLHLQGQRRGPRLEHRDRQPDGHSDQRRPGRGGRCLLARPRTRPWPWLPRASSATTPTPTATRCLDPGRQRRPRHPHPGRQRLDQLRPDRRLRRSRQLHLQGQRRGARFEHGHGQPDRHRHQRRPGRGGRLLLTPKKTAPSPCRRRASSPTTPTPTATRSPRSWWPTSATARSPWAPTAAHHLHPGPQLQRPRQLHLQGQRRDRRFEHRHGQPDRQQRQRGPPTPTRPPGTRP